MLVIQREWTVLMVVASLQRSFHDNHDCCVSRAAPQWQDLIMPEAQADDHAGDTISTWQK